MPLEHRVIVCGSREWTDRTLIHDTLAALTEHGRVVIVHGAARGADRIADKEARALGFDVEPHRADWRRYGKRAGPIRNALMLSLGCSQVIAFWDGYSRGTEHMIRIARESEARVTVVRERAVA